MNNPNPPDYIELGKKLEAYCKKFSIPIEHFFEILNDQKVSPMLRGKGMEYNAVQILQHTVNSREWQVNKLNLSAQPGTPDQDIGLIHKRTGITLIVESKSAVRGSATAGVSTRAKHHVPNFKVKCHKSRSNTKKLGQGNDRYTVKDFDIIISNPLNALFKKGTIGEDLELVDDSVTLETLYQFYNVSNESDLLLAAARDWRFVIAADIADDTTELIPRTPTVYLASDPHWKPLSALDTSAMTVVSNRHTQRRRSGHN